MLVDSHKPSSATDLVADTIEQQPRPATEASQPYPLSSRSIVCAGLFAAVVLAVFLALGASVAQAEVTASTITSPADPSFFEFQGETRPTFTIAGTTAGSGNVQIRCYFAKTSVQFVKEVPVTPNGESGEFSEKITLPATEKIRDGIGTCILRAVPVEAPASLNLEQFTGPRLGLGDEAGFMIEKGPNQGDLYDFFAESGQLGGFGDYRSFSFGGLFDARPTQTTATTVESGGDLFFGNDAYAALTGEGATRSDVQVDNANAFGSAAAAALFTGSSEIPGFRPLSFSQSYDPSNGDLMIHEEEPLVECAPKAIEYPPKPETCTEFTSTGVAVRRSIVQDHNGRQATISDSYVSTDGAAHQLNLISVEDAQLAEAGYEFPWEGGPVSTHHAGDPIVSPPAAVPTSVFIKYNNALADDNVEGAQGAITFSTPPDRFEFGTEGIPLVGEESPAGTHLLARFARTVPAGGSLKLTQVFSWAFAKAEAQTLAGEAEAAIRPKIAITSPVSGLTVGQASLPLSGTVTAGGNGMPEAVMINGESVPVAANGGWSATVALNPGQNTITASTTDPGGIGASAQIAIAYQPPVTSLPPESAIVSSPPSPASSPSTPPAKAAATIAKSGFNGKYVWLRLACQNELPCTGKASDTAKLKVTIKSKKGAHPVTRIEHMTVASGNFSISPGSTATIKLKMTNSAKTLVARLGKLFTTVRVTLNQPGNSHTPVTAFLIIHKLPAKHSRH